MTRKPLPKVTVIIPLTRAARITSAATIFLALASASHAFTLNDPALSVGKDAIDPVGGSDGGTVDITVVAGGAPTKAKPKGVSGMRVVQSFAGFEGALKSPVNSIVFSDTSLPKIIFTINSNKGYGGCHAAGAFTSGPVLSERPGEAIYLGDDVNETAYSIEFSTPVTAVAFTIGRLGATTGPPPTWAASFYGPDGQLIGQQSAQPGQGPKVAALFGQIAAPGTAIQRVVFGKSSKEVSFVMGNHKIYLDDLAFAPSVPAEPPAGVMKQPALVKSFDPDGGESIDLIAQGATPKSFLEGLVDFGVVTERAGFPV